jgi:sulfur-oxidizing protein SoxY
MNTINPERRHLLKIVFAGSAVTFAFTTGLATPVRLLADDWPRRTFEATGEAEILNTLFGHTNSRATDAVRIEAPTQSNGAVVSVKVVADLIAVEAIAVVTRNNPQPLNTFVSLSGAAGFYTCRIRVYHTSPITAYVKAGGKLYSTSALIKINTSGDGMRF